MTAINVFADNEFAYLSTDSAMCNYLTGDMVAVTQKAAMLVEQRMVLGCYGRLLPPSFLLAIDQVHRQWEAVTQRSVLQALPEALRLARQTLARSDPEDEARDMNGSGVLVATYDMDADRPRVYGMHTGDTDGWDFAPAFELFEFDFGFSMPALTAEDQDAVFPNGYTADARREMAGMLTLQRTKPFPTIRCGVGSQCYFYQVGRGGVTGGNLIAFPDVIGQPMDPHLEAAA